MRLVLGLSFALLLAAGLFLMLKAPLLPDEEPLAPEVPEDPADALSNMDPVMGPLILLEEYQERPLEESRELLEELSARDDAVGYLAALDLARRLPDPPKALEFYRRALELHRTDEVQEETAALLLEAGKNEEARDLYRELLPSDEAVKGLIATGLDIAQVMEELVQGSHFQAARDLAQDLSARNEEEERLYLRALAGLREYREAAPGLEAYCQAHPEDEEMKYWYGRALEALGQTGEALEVYAELGPAGGYRKGLILEGRGDLEGAARALSGSPGPEGRWRGAGLWELLGRMDKALEVYRELASESGPASDDAAFRIQVLLGDEDPEGAAEFSHQIESSPSWMDRLGRQPVMPTAPPRAPRVPGALERVEAYREAGRSHLAELELAIFSEGADTAERLDLGDWHLEQGHYFTAVRLGIGLLRRHPCPRAYRLAYPLPFLDLVLEAARDFDLEPELILAVMREESHYRPRVISWAGAVGLMQVMPQTGRGIAAQKGLDPDSIDLTDPETSIRFGAFYLRAMLDSFGGNLDHALAAYNAGPGNAQRWIRSPLGSDRLNFPRAVTFVETRQYITRVTDTYLTYRWLYGGLKRR